MVRFDHTQLTEAHNAVTLEPAHRRAAPSVRTMFVVARRAVSWLAVTSLVTSLLVACSGPPATPDNSLTQSVETTDETELTPDSGAEPSERTPVLSADEDRFLRRVVPDYDQLMIAGNPRLALDAWAEGAESLELWFPGPATTEGSGCVSVALERSNNGWRGQLPICPELAEYGDVESHCSIGIDESLNGSLASYMVTAEDGTGSGGAMSHACNIPTLSATHWGDEQISFGGICARVVVRCTAQSTTQTCMDGSQRTCQRCSDVQTNVLSCGHGMSSVGHSMSLNIGPNRPVDCSRPCEPGVTPADVERANELFQRVDWMQQSDEQLNVYRSASSCASDTVSMHATDQTSACEYIAAQVRP